eukprot:m51a1_g176 putative regulator of telomere elongation helicase 1-like (853) ;mRNA; r:584092-587690
MAQLSIRGVDVQFPYASPYPCQLVYMERLIQALQEGKNALLESPTGTGKTLCLLCGTLGWAADQALAFAAASPADATSTPAEPDAAAGEVCAAKSKAGRPPVVVYASRTHSQLCQAARELKATEYRVRTAVLGSRGQLCVHPAVSRMRGSAQNRACLALCAARKCEYREGLRTRGASAAASSVGGDGPLDVEDLVKGAQQEGVCPYYMEREVLGEAQVVFLPYNYLLDPRVRAPLAEPLRGAVLVFDEAHNLDQSCSEMWSYDLSASGLAGCLDELAECSRRIAQGELAPELDAAALAAATAALQKLAAAVQSRLEGAREEISLPGQDVFYLLGEAGVDSDELLASLADTVDRAQQMSASGDGAGGGGDRLEVLGGLLQTLVLCAAQRIDARAFRLCVERPLDVRSGAWSLGFWCFKPSIAMASLIKDCGIASVVFDRSVLTSGTLAPLDTLASELGIPFDVRLENPHVVPQENVWAGTLTVGPSNSALNGSYKNRSNPQYVADVGNALVNFARMIPAGVLVFFPSYKMLSTCVEEWKQRARGMATWQLIEKHKRVFVEPKFAAQMGVVFDEFCREIKTGSGGAMFFAVARGKVSEGLDFSDDNARAAVVIGLPYPNVSDTRVKLKRKFLDDQVAARTTASAWYAQQAMRAVNQCIGRVIRHKGDYGAIILCDDRFASQGTKEMLPAWIRPSLREYKSFGDSMRSIVAFFKTKSPASRSEPAVLPVKPEEGADMASPVEQKSSGPSSSSRSYIQKLKTCLPPAEYQKFRSRLSELKDSMKDKDKAETLISEVKGILQSSGQSDLWQGFVSFIPKPMRSRYQTPVDSEQVPAARPAITDAVTEPLRQLNPRED